MHTYSPNTAGESLFLHIYQELARNSCWKGVSQALRVTGDGDKYVDYILQHAALYVCCSLISAGKSHLDIASIIQSGSWRSLDNSGRLYRLLTTAVEKSDTAIPNGIARSLQRFSEEKHSWCYICGVNLNYIDPTNRSYFTLDHLWPRTYGGESTESNLLPACMDCNVKKDNMALWVASDVHAAFFGINPNSTTLSRLKSERRIALYQRAAINLALKRKLQLKQAYLALGPWGEVSTYDADLVAEMFNMRIHEDSNLYDDEII